MCKYSYVYFSTCQHADFYRVSYCDKANARRAHQHDSHSPNDKQTGEAPDSGSSHSSSTPPVSSSSNNNRTHSHSQQQQNIQNMSTLTAAERNTAFPHDATLAARGGTLPVYASIVPRSAQEDSFTSNMPAKDQSAALFQATHASGSLDIHMPLSEQSSMAVEIIKNVTHTADPDAMTQTAHAESVIVANTETRIFASRKPLPAQWLPFSSGPSLATAQRAKEREHKRESADNSPIDAKTIRSKRSSATLGRAGGAEGPTFLTKEALASVEGNIVSPTNSPRSPTRTQKPAWQSPTVSPRRESPRQNATVRVKMSPTRPTFLSAEASASFHKRGPSSVATSSGDTVFHDAEGSPVRSVAGSDQSFQTAPEALDQDESPVPYLCLGADHDLEQGERTSSGANVSTIKGSTVGRASLKPKLSVQIPAEPYGEQSVSSASTSSATSGFGAGLSPNSPASASSTSRIPRAAANTMRSARDPTRSSTLKRTQSLKSLTSKARDESSNKEEDRQTRQVSKTPAAHGRHVRTLDSANNTPIISRKSTTTMVPSMADQMHTVEPTLIRHATGTAIESCPHNTDLPRIQELASGPTSRTSSSGTVRVSQVQADPVARDSAIIYSRRKSDSSGITPPPNLQSLPIIVMMAHNLDIGISEVNNQSDNATEISHEAFGHAVTLPQLGQANPSTSSNHDEVDSLHSSHASDLRATAPVFVPHSTQTDAAGNTAVSRAAPAIQGDSFTSQLHELDMYGIPWFYYMYQVQAAYNQGFQSGRSKSPKKKGRKKPWLTDPSQNNPASSKYHEAIPLTQPVNPDPNVTRPQSRTDMPPPASTVPLAIQRAQALGENARPAQMDPSRHATDQSAEPYVDPFADQLNFINRQTALTNLTNRPRNSDVDLTSVRNVNLPQEQHGTHPRVYGQHSHTLHSRSSLPHNVRRNYNHSDNGVYSYRGRGNVGVPIDAVPFPDPIAPQGRPQVGFQQQPSGTTNMTGFVGYSVPVGEDACDVMDIVSAAEWGGGPPCNACAPDHPHT